MTWNDGQMVTRVFLPLILIVGALVAVGIVLPTLNGPFRIDCGETAGSRAPAVSGC